jgi:H+/Cl- antiporter ClcA
VEAILTWQVGVFALAVFIVTHFVKKLIEAVVPAVRKDTPLTTAQRVWELVVLPSLPVLVGVLVGVMAKSWPWPPGITTPGARAVLGVVVGFFSTWFYRILKAIIQEKFKVNLDAEANLPVAVGVASEKKESDTPKP